MALTATATKKSRDHIITVLGMRSSLHIVSVIPHKPNTNNPTYNKQEEVEEMEVHVNVYFIMVSKVTFTCQSSKTGITHCNRSMLVFDDNLSSWLP